jgi:hypothetical protein
VDAAKQGNRVSLTPAFSSCRSRESGAVDWAQMSGSVDRSFAVHYAISVCMRAIEVQIHRDLARSLVSDGKRPSSGH